MWKPLKTPIFFGISAILLNFGHPINSDEGVILNGAWQMFNNKSLYIDFFSYIAPGSYLWTKWSFDIFGPSYWSARLFSLFLLLLSVYAVYQIAMSLAQSKSVAMLSAWLWLFFASIGYPIINIGYPIINHNTHSSYLAAVAIYLFIRAVKSNLWTDYFLSGLSL